MYKSFQCYDDALSYKAYCFRPLNYQHDQSLPEKPDFCHLIDSLGFLASKRPFSIIVQCPPSAHCIALHYMFLSMTGLYVFFVISLLYCYKDLNYLHALRISSYSLPHKNHTIIYFLLIRTSE